MRDKLEQFAVSYAAAEDQFIGSGDGRSSIHYPAVFLFIGDHAGSAISHVMDMNDRKWDNSAGVTYIHVHSGTDASKGHSRVLTHQIRPYKQAADPREDEKRLNDTRQDIHGDKHLSLHTEVTNPRYARSDLYRDFYADEEGLIQLNGCLRRASLQLAEYGRLYSSFDRVHLTVITVGDDPLNVLVPEITLLSEYLLAQSFKSVQMDLYALLHEGTQENYGYSSALNVAFLRELDHMQDPGYQITAILHMTEDRLGIKVKHGPAPLFDLVYLLSDKDERGRIVPDSLRENSELICHIQLLKNRLHASKGSSIDDDGFSEHWPQDGGYNNTSFKNNMGTETGRPVYVSAGLGKVKRPNAPIALTVLYQFYKQLLSRMKSELAWSPKDKLSFFRLDSTERESWMSPLLPPAEFLGDMTGLMTSGASFSALRRMTLRDAEAALFGEACGDFFREHAELPAKQRLDSFDADQWLQQLLKEQETRHPDIGLYEILSWTDEDQPGNVLTAIRGLIRDYTNERTALVASLEQLYNQTVEELSFPRVPLLDKPNVRNFIRYVAEQVYGRKLELLELQMYTDLLRTCEAAFERLHGRVQAQLDRLRAIEQQLQTQATEHLRRADQYTGQNVLEYYAKVTAEVLDELESKRGQDVLFSDRHMGSKFSLVTLESPALLERLIHTCQSLILTAAPFRQTFEEELLLRANVASAYENRQIVSKDQLFKELYHTLEEGATVHIRLLDYTHEHRYEEKYFFGDYEGEFLPYAMKYDHDARMYKLGFVHVTRSSGVEKLHLMGGFQIEDILVYRNGRTYYETYTANGYRLHGLDPQVLPELR